MNFANAQDFLSHCNAGKVRGCFYCDAIGTNVAYATSATGGCSSWSYCDEHATKAHNDMASLEAWRHVKRAPSLLAKLLGKLA